MKRHSVPEAKIDTNRWLLTYSDLMNNLLVMFIVLYMMSITDLTKFQELIESFQSTFHTQEEETVETGTGEFSIEDLTLEDIEALQNQTVMPSISPEPTVSAEAVGGGRNLPDEEGMDDYDELVKRISDRLAAIGYDKTVIVEKTGDFIFLRFREGVFFEPNLAVLKDAAFPVLQTISEVILESYDLISNIDISGHTAKTPNDPRTKENLFSWELSTNRALTVLKYLVQQCDMPQEKLSASGYSCNQLYVEGDSEEYWAQNRRVEIRLKKATADASLGPDSTIQPAPTAFAG